MGNKLCSLLQYPWQTSQINHGTFPTESRLNLKILNPDLQIAPAIDRLTNDIKSMFRISISAWLKLCLAFLVPQ